MPVPVVRMPGWTPSFRTSSTKVPFARPTRTLTSVGLACLSAFLSASASTDCASASTSAGTCTPSSQSSSSGRSL